MQQQAIINQLITETAGKNMNKDGIRLLCSRPIDPKQSIRIFEYRDEAEVSKILRKFIGDDVFFKCFKCVSR